MVLSTTAAKKSSSTVKTFVNVEVSIFYKSIKWTPFSAV